MVGSNMLDGIVSGLITIGCLIILAIWGAWEAVDYFFIDDAIRVETPLIPEIEITVKDNVIDTIYIYRQPYPPSGEQLKLKGNEKRN